MSDTLHKKLKDVASQFPEEIAMQMRKEDVYVRYTYKELYGISQSIAHSLLDLGIKKGDRLAIVLENRPEWGMIYFAILFAGGIAVPIDHQSNQEEIRFILGESESKVVFTSSEHLSLFESATSLQKIVVLDYESRCVPQGFSQRLSKRYIDFSKVISPVPDSVRAELSPEVSVQDIASILYTSGTTGKPKGVMLTHKNFYSNFQSIDKLKLFSDKDNIISILPLHHSYPFMVTLIIPLFCRARITYISSLKSDELLECMRETAVTILVGVPQLFYMFYKHILDEIKKIPFLLRMPLLGFIELLWLLRKFSRINLTKLALSKIHRTFGRNLRFFACGGAKLNEEAARFLLKLGFTILEGYGLTETSPVVTFNPLHKQKIGSTGKVIPDVELRIVNPNDEGIGEVIIKGPNVMKGYYKRDEETRSVLRDNWFYSGDIGYLDREGYLYLTGRKKELIVLSSGKNIPPEEVEFHYAKSPFIKEVCVLAVGEREEERLSAVIVPDLDYCRKVGEVNVYGRIKWDLENLSTQLPSYKRIMGFIVVKEDLPRTRLGKIKRFEVEEKYWDELRGVELKKSKDKVPPVDGDLRILSSEVGKKIIEVLNKEVKVKREVSLDDHLELDLGIDSLGRAELMAALEKAFKINLPDSLNAGVFTVREAIFQIEKLILEKGVQDKEILPLKTQAALWNELLQRALSKDTIQKIDLSPNWIGRLFTLLGGGILYLTFKIFWQFKILGIKNIPKKGAFILCSNHGSYLDGFLMAASVPALVKKDMYFLGLRAYFEIPVIKNLIKLIKVIPIDPATNMVDAMQACSYILRNGKMLCIFPEGGRSIDGGVKEFKKGVGILAKELSIRLVPVYISGSYESWPRTNRFPRPHPVTIVFGRPRNAEELKKEGIRLGAKDDYEAIALGIREEVIRLKPR